MFPFLDRFFNWRASKVRQDSLQHQSNAREDTQPEWADELLRKHNAATLAELKTMIPLIIEQTWTNLNRTPAPPVAVSGQRAWDDAMEEVSSAATPPNEVAAESSSAATDSSSDESRSTDLQRAETGDYLSTPGLAVNDPKATPRERLELERLESKFDELVVKFAQYEQNFVAFTLHHNSDTRQLGSKTEEIDKRLKVVHKYLASNQGTMNQAGKLPGLLEAYSVRLTEFGNGFISHRKHSESQLADLLKQSLAIKQHFEHVSAVQLPEMLDQLITDRLYRIVVPRIQAMIDRLEASADSLHESLQENAVKLEGSDDLLRQALGVLRNAAQMQSIQGKKAIALEELECSLTKRQLEMEQSQIQFEKQEQLHQELLIRHQQLVSEVERLQKMQQDLAAIELPELLRNPLLIDEKTKLGDSSVETILLLGSVYQFGASLQAAQYQPDNLEYVYNLQESVSQLGAALMKKVNSANGEALQSEKWRKATEEAVQSWFKIHLPIQGQPFNPNLMDMTKTGVVRRVKNWAVLPNDARLRVKVASVE